MSTIRQYTTQCALCGKESKHHVVSSYSLFGFPDLDFRPQTMYRETMRYWMPECPNCGYANIPLNRLFDLPKETILKIIDDIKSGFHWDETYAIRFARMGAMLAESNDYQGAATQFLRVAWAFDDDRDEQSAAHWRKVAMEHVTLEMTKISEEMVCIYADMLRRTGDFHAVLSIDESQLHDNLHIRLIEYQKELSEQEDRAAHTLDENSELCKLAKDYQGGMFFCL